jgi:sugar lactone lactonase YvrE
MALLLAALPAFAELYTVEHYAGSTLGPGYADGSAAVARLQAPSGVAVDASGNVYVADRESHTIRRIAPDGEVTTFAGLSGASGSADGRGGAARFYYPTGLATDVSGNLIVGDNRIRRISPQGVVTTVAVIASNAVAVDNDGYIYAAGSTGGGLYGIRKVAPNGTSVILPGTSSGDYIRDVAVNRTTGDVFFTRGGALYRYTPAGALTTIATGGIDFVAVEAAGTLVTTGGYKVERVTVNGTRTVLAGTGQQGGTDGAGQQASFLFTSGIAVTSGGTIYVTEAALSARVRKITPANVVSTISGGQPQSGQVNGPLASARFWQPTGIVRDSAGNLFVAESHNRAIRKITPAGVVTTFAGGNGFGYDDGTGAAAKFIAPNSIAIDASDNLYVADWEAHTIRKITPGGVVTTLAGLGGMSGAINANGTNARFYYPNGLVVGTDGNVYVADTANQVIRKVTPSGDVTTFAGTMGIAGNHDATGTAAGFTAPVSITRTSDGTLYVSANNAVRRITVPGAVVTTFAGTSGTSGLVDATGTAAFFLQLSRIGVDGNDNLFVADNFLLRKITTPGAVVTTVAGKAFTEHSSNVSGTGELARFFTPAGMCSDGGENLYVLDAYSQNIRFVSPAGLEDGASLSSVTPPVGSVVTLSTYPETSTSWTWSVLRRPSGSTAQLSSPSARNPTFTPDVADLYVMLLRAEGPDGVRYSTISFTATDACGSVTSVVASITGSPARVCVTGTGATATVTVDGGSGNESFRWGWRATPGGSVSSIGVADASSYQIRGEDFGGTTGTKYLVAVVTLECGGTLVSNELAIEVVGLADNTISASSGVYGSSDMNFASVPDAGPGTTYAWSITNGVITSGQGTRSIVYSAGSFGEVIIGVTINNSCEVNGQVYVPIITRPAGASLLYLVTPCRVIDTRGNPIADGATRTLTIGGLCNVPVGATAIALNVTAVAPAAAGFASLYPSNVAWPGNSTINYRAGKTRANNAIVAVAPDGTINLRNVGATTDFIIDVTGYFN